MQTFFTILLIISLEIGHLFPKQDLLIEKPCAVVDFMIYSWAELLQKYILGLRVSSLYGILGLLFEQVTRYLM